MKLYFLSFFPFAGFMSGNQYREQVNHKKSFLINLHFETYFKPQNDIFLKWKNPQKTS